MGVGRIEVVSRRLAIGNRGLVVGFGFKVKVFVFSNIGKSKVKF